MLILPASGTEMMAGLQLQMPIGPDQLAFVKHKMGVSGMKQKLFKRQSVMVAGAALSMLALSGTAQATDVSAQRCVTVPGNDGVFVGIATPLTGPVGVTVPGRRALEICGSVSCGIEGDVSITRGTPSFPDCEVGYTVDANGNGSCTATLTRDGLLGPFPILTKTYDFDTNDLPDAAPVEVCLSRVPAE